MYLVWQHLDKQINNFVKLNRQVLIMTMMVVRGSNSSNFEKINFLSFIQNLTLKYGFVDNKFSTIEHNGVCWCCSKHNIYIYIYFANWFSKLLPILSNCGLANKWANAIRQYLIQFYYLKVQWHFITFKLKSDGSMISMVNGVCVYVNYND